jgi:SAM-dependent methyltransferase
MSLFAHEQGLYDDPAYLDAEAQYASPKESHKAIAAMIAARHGGRPLSVLDVGCAAGALLHHIKATLNVGAATGMDNAEGLLTIARRLQPDVEFVNDTVTNTETLAGRTFDVTLAVGLLGIFDDFDEIVKTLWSFVKPGGSLYIFDHCNDDPVDVIVRYRRSDRPDDWHSGWNVRSQATYEKAIRAAAADAEVVWRDFVMPFAIPKHDPLRAWTIRTEQREHQIVVGTGQLLFHKIIEVSRPL